MTAHAPDLTERYYVQYTIGGRRHTMTFRYNGAGSAPDAPFIAGVTAFLNSLRTKLFNGWTITGASFSAAGSSVRLPATPPTILPGGEALLPGFQANYLTFVGKDAAGTPARVLVFGTTISPSGGAEGNDFRVNATEDIVISDAISALVTLSPVSVAGAAVLWNPYANLGVHAHWQKKSRG